MNLCTYPSIMSLVDMEKNPRVGWANSMERWDGRSAVDVVIYSKVKIHEGVDLIHGWAEREKRKDKEYVLNRTALRLDGPGPFTRQPIEFMSGAHLLGKPSSKGDRRRLYRPAHILDS